MFQPFVTVQGSKDTVSQLLKASGVDKKGIRKIPQAKMKDALQLHRKHFGNYMIINQPYELTDETIEYMSNYIKPMGFITLTSTTARQKMLIEGMSFHIKYQAKVGQVMHMHYKGNNQEDFDNHVQASLKILVDNILSEGNKDLHMVITFTNKLHFGKVLQVLFRNCLRPGLLDEGYCVNTKSQIIDSRPKL